MVTNKQNAAEHFWAFCKQSQRFSASYVCWKEIREEKNKPNGKIKLKCLHSVCSLDVRIDWGDGASNNNFAVHTLRTHTHIKFVDSWSWTLCCYKLISTLSVCEMPLCLYWWYIVVNTFWVIIYHSLWVTASCLDDWKCFSHRCERFNLLHLLSHACCTWFFTPLTDPCLFEYNGFWDAFCFKFKWIFELLYFAFK